MSSLRKLIYLNYKAMIRNLFSKFSTGLFTVLLIAFYAFLLIVSIQSAKGMSLSSDLNSTIMLLLGMLAFLVLSSLFTKKKVILKEADANMLFSGPYTRKSVMSFIVINTTLQSLMVALYPLYFLLCFSLGAGLSLGFILIAYLFSFLITYFFLLFSDFIHLYEIKDKKYLWLGKGITLLAILIVGALFMVSLSRNNFVLASGFNAFLQATEFYFIPFFGWVKYGLISFVNGDLLIALVMLFLLVFSCAIVIYFFINYRDDFYEAAIKDAEDFTVRYAAAKKGKISVDFNEKQLEKSKSSFKQGAWAIFSKNFILLRRSKNLISKQGIIMLVIFFAYALFLDLGETYYISMSLFALFMTCNDVSIEDELKNYQIYLIPDGQVKKAFACIGSQSIKSMVFILINTLFYAFGFQASLFSIVIFFFNQIALGLMMSVSMMLSFKIMKSRNNQFISQMLKMLTIIILLIPSLFIMGVSIVVWGMNLITMMVIPVLANVLVSLLILIWTANIFSGTDLLSE